MLTSVTSLHNIYDNFQKNLLSGLRGDAILRMLKCTVNPKIFAKCVKRHNYELKIKNSRLGLVLPLSVDGRVILPFLEGFIFTKLRTYAKFRENKTLAKISEFTVCQPAFFQVGCRAAILNNISEPICSCAQIK